MKEAISEYANAIRLDSDLAFSYYNRGTPYFNLGQHQRAIEDYDEDIRLDPEDAETYNNWGLAYVSLVQYQRAIKGYDEAIRWGHVPSSGVRVRHPADVV